MIFFIGKDRRLDSSGSWTDISREFARLRKTQKEISSSLRDVTDLKYRITCYLYNLGGIWSGLSESNRHLNLGKSEVNGKSGTYEALSGALSSV
jgi:hypothetical protein